MKWNKYTILTTTEAEDAISAELAALGIEGVEIENNVPLTEEETGRMFIDFPPELPPDDGTSRVSFYLDAASGHSAELAQVQEALDRLRQFMDIGPGTITGSQTEDVDWINNWKQFFTSFTIGNIRIKPTWEPLGQADPGRILIEIDPGVSFGTGKHETTQLCIRQLQKYVQVGGRVLDVGCGSGILSIAALKLGAGSVEGIDIDETCIGSACENMRVNHLDASLWKFYSGNLLTDTKLQKKFKEAPYDIIVANILADVIIPMAPLLQPCLKPGGVLVTSGIIDFKEKEVMEAFHAAGFTVLEVNRQGEWVNITGEKGKRKAASF